MRVDSLGVKVFEVEAAFYQEIQVLPEWLTVNYIQFSLLLLCCCSLISPVTARSVYKKVSFSNSFISPVFSSNSNKRSTYHI